MTSDEVDDACHGHSSNRETYGGRLMLISPTRSGRLLAIDLAPKGPAGTYYPVTTWPGSGKLQRIYAQEHGQEEAA